LEIIKIQDQNLLNIKIIKIYSGRIFTSKNPSNDLFNLNNFSQTYLDLYNQINYKVIVTNIYSKNFILSKHLIFALNQVFYAQRLHSVFIFVLINFFLNVKSDTFFVQNSFSNNVYNIFIKKNKLFYFYFFKNPVFAFSLNEFQYFNELINVRINSGFLKKSFLKKFKKTFKKIENFPWKLKNFLLKRLVKIKHKQCFFLKKNAVNKNYNFFLNYYLMFFNAFFSKKNVFRKFFKTDLLKKQHSLKLTTHSLDFYFFFKFVTISTNITPIYKTVFYKTVFLTSYFYSCSFLKKSLKNILQFKKIDYLNYNCKQKYFELTSCGIILQFLQTFYILDKKKNFKKFNFLKSLISSHFKLLMLKSTPSFLTFVFFSKNIQNTVDLTKESNNANHCTNYTPLSLLDLHAKIFIFKKFNESNQPLFYKYIYHYLNTFFENFFKKRIFLKIKTKVHLNEFYSTELFNIFNKHRSYQSKVGRGFFFFEMLEILFISFLYKDVNLLIDWFVKTMERIQFRSHKKFISTFKFILMNYQDLFVYSNSVKGFFFDVRGKVGVAGNAKKRHFSFNVGKFSKTTKSSKIEYQQQIVRTFTGALGVTMIIYF